MRLIGAASPMALLSCVAAVRVPVPSRTVTPVCVVTSRRAVIAGAASALLGAGIATADETQFPDWNQRMRGGGKEALIPGDYYYIYGTVPPRQISAPNIEQPKFNTFGSCVDNSCTYVPIQQRYSAYTKYELRLSRGLRIFSELKGAIERRDWTAVAAGVYRGEAGTPPSPAVDALLKAGLLASQLLVSPNNLREKKESSLAIFYVNEASYALELLGSAASKADAPAALAAWDFGRDSWNSYLAVVNPSIVPKVGEPFGLIP